MSEKPWYSEGLDFQCTGCGACCTGTPGYVWINEDEATAIANFLKITIAEFSKKYLRCIEGRFALKELLPNYDCIFLKDKKCTIYDVRPVQCRTFPYWPENLSSRSAWENLKSTCEGTLAKSPRVDKKTIEDQQLIQINRRSF